MGVNYVALFLILYEYAKKKMVNQYAVQKFNASTWWNHIGLTDDLQYFMCFFKQKEHKLAIAPLYLYR